MSRASNVEPSVIAFAAWRQRLGKCLDGGRTSPNAADGLAGGGVPPHGGSPPFDLAAEAVRGYVLLVASTGHEPSLDSRAREMDSIIAQVCPEGVPAGHPVIVGVVSDAASGERVEGAEVRLSWSTAPEALAEQGVLGNAQGVARAGSTGFFGVCGAPMDSRIFLHAVDGDRVSD